jgi:hypothetical protein
MSMTSIIFPASEVMGSISAPIMQKIMALYIGDKKQHRIVFIFFEELKNIEKWVAWFLTKLCKAEKGVQKDKRNQCQTKFIRGCFVLSDHNYNTIITTCFFAIQCSFEKTRLNLLWFKLSTCGIPFT